jgi:hypothetical protein
MELKDRKKQKLTVIEGGRNKDYEEKFLKKLILRTDTEDEFKSFTKVKIGKLTLVHTEKK